MILFLALIWADFWLIFGLKWVCSKAYLLMSWLRFEGHEYIWLSFKSIVKYSSFAMLSFVIAATSRTGQRLLLAAEQLISCCALRSAWEGPLSLKFRSEPGYYFGYFGDTKFGWFRTGFSCEGVAYCWKQSLAAWASKHEVGLARATFWGSRKPPKVVISLSTSYKNQVAEQSSTKIFRKGLFGSFWTAMSSPSHFLGDFGENFGGT